MFRQKRIKALLILTLISTAVLNLTPAQAQIVNSSDFSVRAIIPENQIGKNNGYFDLLMEPGQSQTLEVEVINSGSEEITVDVALRAASTNRNGIIEYQVEVNPDETLKYPFDTLADTAGEIKVAPGSVKKAEIAVTMPEQSYDGVILGGIIFTRRDNSAASAGVSINNQFSYVIGVALTETSTEILPEFLIKSVEPTLLNYRKAVAINIRNPVALIVKNANISADIYRKNESAPLFTVNKSGIDMAPNSIFPLPVEWENSNIESGEYRLHIKLTYEGKIWEWDQEFAIEAEKAREVNSGALDKPIRTNWWSTWWWNPLLVIAILLLLWVAFLLGRRKRNDEDNKIKG